MSKYSILALLATAVAAKRWTTSSTGPTFDITYDTTKTKFKFDVTVKANSELWIVYGTNGATN